MSKNFPNRTARLSLGLLMTVCCLGVTNGCIVMEEPEDDDDSSTSVSTTGASSGSGAGAGGSSGTGVSNSSSSGTSGSDCSNVIVVGSYQVELDLAASDAECAENIGSGFLSMVSQTGCSVSATTQVGPLPVSLDGDLVYRGGSNAHGYGGATVVGGMAMNYDVEFRCSTDPTCEYLDYAVVTISIPAAGASCAYRGYLL